MPAAVGVGTLVLTPGMLYTLMVKRRLPWRRCQKRIYKRRNKMTLCPVALAVGCKKCPVFGVCFLKGVIGDYKKEEEAQTKQQAEQATRDGKH